MPLADGGGIQGVNESTLTIFKVFEGDEGSYQCVVQNTAGTSTSNAALLSVGKYQIQVTNDLTQYCMFRYFMFRYCMS